MLNSGDWHTQLVDSWRLREDGRIHLGTAGPQRTLSCDCVGWDGSPVLESIETSWELWRNNHVLHTGPRPFFESLNFLGASFLDTRNFCDAFTMEFATALSGASRVPAIDEFGKLMLGSEHIHGECPGAWGKLAILCGLKMSFTTFGWLPRQEDFFKQNSLDYILGEGMLDWGLGLSFYCGGSDSDADGSRHAVPHAELALNARRWLRRFAGLDSATGRPHTEALRYKPLDDWHRMSSTEEEACPDEGEEPDEPLPAEPRVLCLMPAAWPDEEPLMREISASWAGQCDVCIFFIGGSGPQQLPPCHVVDLRELGFPPLEVSDSWQNHQNGQNLEDLQSSSVPRKLQAIYQWAGSFGRDFGCEWACFVESDVYFAVANFRRLVRRHALSADDSHWLGYLHMAKMVEEGITVEPFHGACLSRAALPRASLLRPSQFSLWPPTKQTCRMLKSSEAPLFTNVLNTCMRIAFHGSLDMNTGGVLPSDPELAFDARGRLLYLSWTPFHCNILNDTDIWPPRYTFSRLNNNQSARFDYWRGREYIYAPCLRKNRTKLHEIVETVSRCCDAATSSCGILL
eukprot:TRINITY_DN20260_c1_g1_i3.p1 TRINITY_DN20260_c1_g1~~TRINITY_DN20260_c1_g1_i3.p1  ORF type:complete len:572 (-),score=93.61 TRINITY_DN20260_c1_g1_i3:599-2314(-)